MAGHFPVVLRVIIVAMIWRGTLGDEAPQPEQIHISSTGKFNI